MMSLNFKWTAGRGLCRALIVAAAIGTLLSVVAVRSVSADTSNDIWLQLGVVLGGGNSSNQLASIGPDGSGEQTYVGGIGDGNTGVAISPDRTEVAFTTLPINHISNSCNLEVEQLEGSALTTLAQQIPCDEKPVWSPDGTELAIWNYVGFNTADQTEDVNIFNLSGSLVAAIQPSGYDVFPTDWSSDGVDLVVDYNPTSTTTCSWAGGVGILNLSTQLITPMVSNFLPSGVACNNPGNAPWVSVQGGLLSPNGQYLLSFVNCGDNSPDCGNETLGIGNDYGLVVTSTSGDVQTPVLVIADPNAVNSDPPGGLGQRNLGGGYAWSPDGSQIIYGDSTLGSDDGYFANDIAYYITDLDGGSTAGPIFNGIDDQVMAWGQAGSLATGTASATVSITPTVDPSTTGYTQYSVTASGSGAAPTGAVTVTDSGGESCGAILHGGQGSCSLLEAATDSPLTVTATYSGDAYYAPGATAQTTEIIGPETPAVTVTGSPNPANPGVVDYSTTVVGAGVTPTGSVSVSDGSGGSCDATVSGQSTGTSSGSCNIVENAAADPYSVTATYSGDGNYTTAFGSSSETVNQATPTITLTPTVSSTQAGTTNFGITVTGTDTGPDPTGMVSVDDGRGGMCSITLSDGDGTCSISEPTQSNAYQVTATYSGDLNYVGATARIAPVPTVTISASANPGISGPIVYSVTVSGTGPTPTGSVSVGDGEGGTCSVKLIAGAAGCPITEDAGSSPYIISAGYSGDSYYAGGSGSITETVNPAVATITFTPSSNPANEGPVTYTTLVTGNGPVPQGLVTVSDGQGGSCSAALSDGVANCAVSETNLTSPFTITSTYSGDQNYTSASASLADARGVSLNSSGTAVALLGPISASGSGSGTVNVLQYPSDPVGPPTYTASGVFFDASVADGSSFNSEVLQDCDLAGGTTLMWWNPAAAGGAGQWQPVIGDPGPTYTTGPPACLQVTLDNTTSPSLAQLSGTVFGISSSSAVPVITSPSVVKVAPGAGFSFTVSTIAAPIAGVTESTKLPAGWHFEDNHNGTATLSGTAPTKAETIAIAVSASNVLGEVQQRLAVEVGAPAAPKFVTRATSGSFLSGVPFSVTFEAQSWPANVLTEIGALPQGVTFVAGPHGTATLSGTPQTHGTFALVIEATGATGLTTRQAYALTLVTPTPGD